MARGTFCREGCHLWLPGSWATISQSVNINASWAGVKLYAANTTRQFGVLFPIHSCSAKNVNTLHWVRMNWKICPLSSLHPSALEIALGQSLGPRCASGGVFSNTSLLSAVYFTEFPNFKFENHQELNIEISLFTKDFLSNSGVSEPAHLFYSHLILLIVFSANSLQNEGQNYKTRFHIQFLHFKQCK